MAKKRHRTEDALLQGFSWHSVDEEIVRNAHAMISETKKTGIKTAIRWESLKIVPQGLYVEWKHPGGTYNAGYKWFEYKLGELSDDPGNSLQWCVIGHLCDFDASPWESLKAVGQEKIMINFRDGSFSSSSVSSMPNPSATDLSACTPMKEAAKESSVPSWRCLSPAFQLAVCSNGTGALSRGIYKLGESIGQGAFGKTFRSSRDGWLLVVKKLHTKDCFDKLKREAMPEVCALDRCLHHPSHRSTVGYLL